MTLEIATPQDKRIAWCIENIPHFKTAYAAAQAVKAEEAANREKFSKEKNHD